MRRRAGIVLALAAACLPGFWSGCATPGRPSTEAPGEAAAAGPFVALDSFSKDAVACPAAQDRKLADGRLDVAANIANQRQRPVRILVQCLFRDATGRPAGQTPWHALDLGPLATETVHFTAAGTQAAAYSIRVRQP